MALRFSGLALILITLPLIAAPRSYTVKSSLLKGTPVIEANKQTAYFIWNDSDGLHIRWTSDGKPKFFTGRIDLDRPLGEMKRINQNAGGWTRAHGDRVVMFSSTSRGDIDGIDLIVPGGKKARLEIQIEGIEPTIEQVFFGKDLANPIGFPLTLYLR
jgi:hypothetical protein